MPKMPAIIFSEADKPQSLQISEVDIPEPGKGEVLVRVVASALNRRDHWILQGRYPGIKVPCILGSDGCGTVETAGEDVAEALIGRQVVINPGINWGDNPRVQQSRFQILGMPQNGTQAAFVKVPADHVYDCPQHLSAAHAAAIPLGGLTGFRALFTQGKLTTGQTLLLTGIGGGVATLMLLMARAAGARVLVTSGSAEKIETAIAAGAESGANYRSADWQEKIAEQAGPAGIDLIVDSAGGNGFDELINLVNPGGRIVFFGATRGNTDEINLRRIFWKQITLQGTTMGSPEDFVAMLDLFTTHKIEPIIDGPYAFEDFRTAYQRLAENRQFGKIVIAGPDLV